MSRAARDTAGHDRPPCRSTAPRTIPRSLRTCLPAGSWRLRDQVACCCKIRAAPPWLAVDGTRDAVRGVVARAGLARSHGALLGVAWSVRWAAALVPFGACRGTGSIGSCHTRSVLGRTCASARAELRAVRSPCDAPCPGTHGSRTQGRSTWMELPRAPRTGSRPSR